jgi:hypothetical protein
MDSKAHHLRLVDLSDREGWWVSTGDEGAEVGAILAGEGDTWFRV